MRHLLRYSGQLCANDAVDHISVNAVVCHSPATTVLWPIFNFQTKVLCHTRKLAYPVLVIQRRVAKQNDMWDFPLSLGARSTASKEK